MAAADRFFDNVREEGQAWGDAGEHCEAIALGDLLA
jgi:hypothetical protein